MAPATSSTASLVAGTTNWTTSVVGSDPSWLTVRGRTMAEGRFIDSHDLATRAEVVVLGATTAQELFSFRDPVGQTVDVAGQPMSVIGVLNTVGSSSSSSTVADPDDQAVVPLTTASALLTGGTSRNSVSQILIQATSSSTLSAAYQETDAELLSLHGITTATDADFTITSEQQVLSTATSVDKTLTVLLGGIAGISLLVGGIGVMNIMLVSVTERIREIGLRKALGATPRVIRRQFLVEASVLGAVGGLLGTLLGILGGRGPAALHLRPDHRVAGGRRRRHRRRHHHRHRVRRLPGQPGRQAPSDRRPAQRMTVPYRSTGPHLESEPIRVPTDVNQGSHHAQRHQNTTAADRPPVGSGAAGPPDRHPRRRRGGRHRLCRLRRLVGRVEYHVDLDVQAGRRFVHHPELAAGRQRNHRRGHRHLARGPERPVRPDHGDYTSSTVIRQITTTSLSAVTVGSCISAFGKPTTTSSSKSAFGGPITATTVSISQPVSGSCTAVAARREASAARWPARRVRAAPRAAPGRAGGPSVRRRADPFAGGSFATAFGSVTAVAGSTVTVNETNPQTQQTTSVTVTLTPTTTFTTTQTATAAAIVVGQCARATGTADSTGAVTAQSLTISAPTNGSCTTGFGFRGGAGGGFGGGQGAATGA